VKRIIPKLGRVRELETGNLVPGAIARDPRTHDRLPVEGIVVDYVDAFWRRREAEGGVTIVDGPAPDQAAPAPESVTPTTQVVRAPAPVSKE
jgi:hypothetical protein